MSGPHPTMSPEANPADELIGFVRRHHRIVFWLPCALLVLTAAWTLLAGRRYTATASFVSQGGPSTLSRLAGLAAQLGVAIPSSDQGESPQFYADLLASDALIRQLVNRPYQVTAGRGSVVSLLDALNVRTDDSVLRVERGIRRLRRSLSSSVNLKTSVVTLTVELRSPVVAHAVAERALTVLNDFNLRRRQSQAGAERRFVEGRLVEVKEELRQAEDRLESFLRRNREFRSSPQLSFAHDRLQREVVARQEVYTTLMQSYEHARIAEVRDTPVITVLEQPRVPVVPSSRRLLLKSLLALIGGLMLAVVTGLASDVLRGRAAHGLR